VGIKYFIRQSSCHQRRTWPSRQYVKQTSSTRPDDRCYMRHSRIHRLHCLRFNYHKNAAFSLVKCIRWYVWNGPVITFVLVCRKSIHFWRRYDQKTIFYIFVPNDLDLWLLNLKFAPLVTLVQRYVSTKLQQFLFRFMKIGGTDGGRTERRTGCNT